MALALVFGLLAGNPAFAGCGGATATLAAIRGVAGSPVPEGQPVTVSGVVSAVFPGKRGLNGFFIQSARGSDEPVGVFVYTPERQARQLPTPGDQVRIVARSGRYQGHPQLEWVRAIERCGYRRLRPEPLKLPAPDAKLARLAGELVRITVPLTVSDNYSLRWYGSLGLSAGGRLFQAGNGTGTEAAPALVLDDGSYRRSPRPVPFLSAAGTRRLGSRVIGLTGVLTHAFGRWRLHPTRKVRLVEANPRQGAPERQGQWRIVSFNLENYFVTLGSRGADSAAELARQRRRLAATLHALNADVLALQEVENMPRALTSLLAAVNAGLPPAKRYQAAAAGYGRGEAVLRNVLLYRPAVLELAAVWVGQDRVHNRAPVAASFRPTGSGAPFAVATVHFKSKGGCPAQGDVDRGEGCWARRREEQARALVNWLRQLHADVRHDAFLVVGDLNAYASESAPRRLRESGLVDLVARDVPPSARYTYVYHGRAGYLDHALATPDFARRAVATAIWHINADEPRFIAETAPMATPWRVSDHDPVVVDLAAGVE